MSSPADARVKVTPRKFSGEFPDDVPRFWFRGNPILTNMLNTYTVLVPDNEHYYMRNIRIASDRIRNEKLKKTIRDFIRQEGQHGIAHKRFWKNLSSQGLKYQGFLRLTDALSYRFLESVFPLSVQLAVIAAVEHINAYMGHIFIQGDLLRDADSRKRLLFSWHFAEEIEHKAVAYDVFQTVSGNYLLRVAGMMLTAPVFYFFSLMGTVYFSWQWGKLFSMKSWAGWFAFLFLREKVAFKSLYMLLLYFKPGFHPNEIADYDLARSVFESEAFKAVSSQVDLQAT